MNFNSKIFMLLFVALSLGSCVSKKQFMLKQTELAAANADIARLGVELSDNINRLRACEEEQVRLRNEANTAMSNLQVREEQIKDLREQIADIRSQRDKQLTQVDDLTTLSKSASDNIKETLAQLQQKDKYIRLLQAAKTRADSINLALAVNLQGVLRDGIEDKDVEVKVDKTVVFINLSDKMLFQTGSATITPKASDVLGKIAKIIESRPGLEVMVEGYTDNQPISRQCFEDNWDLSTKRATAVVRVLQKNYKIDPNRMIAAGRGEYNILASNATAEGRATNRRTRIIIMPKLDQFYDLLNPDLAPK